jgi:hypothetical protein
MAEADAALVEAPVVAAELTKAQKKKIKMDASKEHAQKMFKFLEEKLPDLTVNNAQKDLPPPVKMPRKRKNAAAKVKFEESVAAPTPAEVIEVKVEEETEPIEPQKAPEAPAPPKRQRIRHDKMIEMIDEAVRKEDPYYRVKFGAGCAVLGALAGYAFAPNLIALRYV